MPANDFKSTMDGFLAPIIDILNAKKPNCEIHWIYPNEPERNNSFSSPATEVEHVLTSMISEGFFASVRFSSTPAREVLQIALWEEWDGEFKGAHWPPSSDLAEFEAVWSGLPSKHKKN